MQRRRFADEAEISVAAGKGGAGCISFDRRRFKPRGAPDGGDGGRGGNVILQADAAEQSLARFRYQKEFRAGNGQPGRGRLQKGADGGDCFINLPLGTLVYDAQQEALLADLVSPGQQLIVAYGGRGGKGNAHFASSRLRTPRFAQPGEPGQQRQLRLELRLPAQVALVGPPNSGKTLLLTRLTAAKAEVSSYPWSTQSPQLGVMPVPEGEPLIILDLPSLVSGAHEGKGLGDHFLRHLSRVPLLLLVLDSTELDPTAPEAAAAALQEVLRIYNPKYLEKKQWLVLNKIDLLPSDWPWPQVLAALTARGWRCYPISAAVGTGLEALRRDLAALSDLTTDG